MQVPTHKLIVYKEQFFGREIYKMLPRKRNY